MKLIKIVRWRNLGLLDNCKYKRTYLGLDWDVDCLVSFITVVFVIV